MTSGGDGASKRRLAHEHRGRGRRRRVAAARALARATEVSGSIAPEDGHRRRARESGSVGALGAGLGVRIARRLPTVSAQRLGR